MIKIITVTEYETTDKKRFTDYNKALEHQGKLDFYKIFNGHCIYTDEGELYIYLDDLWKCKDELIKFFKDK